MSSRLNTIISLIEPCQIFADIGTDHGLIAKAALPFSEKVIASDISEKCLQKAKGLFQTSENVEFIISDGLKSFTQNPCIISICGLGGHTIIGILADYFSKSKTAMLILQPQNDAPLLRQFLCGNNYQITHDIIIKEKSKFYTIIKTISFCNCKVRNSKETQYNKQESLDLLQILFGKFYKDKSLLLKEKLQQDLKRLKTYKATQKNAKLIELTNEALKWQE